MTTKEARKKPEDKPKSLQNKTNEDKDKFEVQKCIERLRELLEGEENLKVRLDDKFLLRYLRWVDFDPDLAFTKIKDIYKFRSETKEWHCSKQPSEYATVIEMNAQVLLGNRDSRGRRVYLVKVGNIDCTNKDVTIHTINYVDDMWLEVAMEEEETQKNGLAIIIDMEGYSWKLFRWLTPQNIRICSRKFYNLTFREIDIHVVNTSSLLDTVVSILYPILGQRIKQHIHFHGQDWASLHKFITPDILPQEYGGHIPQIDFAKAHQYLFDNEEKLMGKVNTKLNEILIHTIQ
ncbi:alpha-tocopherol transfer protein-like isoform X1 [Zootermopsis nevadensis]|uniref:alpha-tocopherol transfer protein-like isoform X1 n=1 Tax=Zootermopsis nevadensis TaxID=136037 RepID=UPI000B8E3B5C|nr:alpha-tocopherol transfer protein-like isoform X1 [Zootermopsis nevadensis]